jgi:hypothetical protein
MSRAARYLLVTLVVVVLVTCLGSEWMIQLPATLLFGWVMFLRRVIPSLQINPSGLALFVICVGVAAVLADATCRWLWRETGHTSPWRAKWTATGLATVLLMFVTGMATTGVGHQVGWMTREPFVQSRSRERANRVKCASNLRQLGAVLKKYIDAHGGRRPGSMADFVGACATDIVSPVVFVCPASSNEKAPGPTTREWASQIAGNHLSYVYLPAGVRTADGRVAIMTEPISNHDGRELVGSGLNVLFDDGRVEWVEGAEAIRIETATTRPTTEPSN